MHNTQATSLKAYIEDVLPTLGNRHREVLRMLVRYNDLTNMELAHLLKWSINKVTPRTNELVKKDLVVQSRIRNCQITNRLVIAWKINKEYKPKGNTLRPEVEEMRIKQSAQESLI